MMGETKPAAAPGSWVVWASPYYGRSSHARIKVEGARYADDVAICWAAPKRWVSNVGSLVRPAGAACHKCDKELERLRKEYGEDYLVPPPELLTPAPPADVTRTEARS